MTMHRSGNWPYSPPILPQVFPVASTGSHPVHLTRSRSRLVTRTEKSVAYHCLQQTAPWLCEKSLFIDLSFSCLLSPRCWRQRAGSLFLCSIPRSWFGSHIGDCRLTYLFSRSYNGTWLVISTVSGRRS